MNSFIGDLKALISQMLKAIPCAFFILLALPVSGLAQQRLNGKIVKKGSQELLADVNVVNLSMRRYTSSDTAGLFSIPADPRDTIIFTSVGYLADTVVVALYMLSENYLVPLVPDMARLPSVEVDELAKYRADSIKRRGDYAFLLNKKHPVKLMNEKRPGDAPGLSFSPLGFFSSKEKQKRRLKKRLGQEEEDDYVNARFSASRVGQLTGLKGDSLRIFMLRYRPSYAFCRRASNQDLLLYINDKLVLFKTGLRAP